jgi:undecaprenyl-diphosphatase
MKEQLSRINERLHRRLPVLWAFIVQRFKRGERYGLDFTLAFIAILVAMWVFIEIIDTAVTETDLYYLDRQIQVFMTDLLPPALADSLVLITNLGGTRGTVIGIFIIGIPLLFTRRWWSLFGLIFTTAGGGLLIWGLKLFFQRARPTTSTIEVGGFAFPSGHAFAAMAFFGYVLYLAFRHFRHDVIRIAATLFCFVMILLIGSSRVFLNVHWLTDVVGGYIAGFAWLILSILIVRHVEWPHRSVPKKAGGEPHKQDETHLKAGSDITKGNPSG